MFITQKVFGKWSKCLCTFRQGRWSNSRYRQASWYTARIHAGAWIVRSLCCGSRDTSRHVRFRHLRGKHLRLQHRVSRILQYAQSHVDSSHGAVAMAMNHHLDNSGLISTDRPRYTIPDMSQPLNVYFAGILTN